MLKAYSVSVKLFAVVLGEYGMNLVTWCESCKL